MLEYLFDIKSMYIYLVYLKLEDYTLLTISDNPDCMKAKAITIKTNKGNKQCY